MAVRLRRRGDVWWLDFRWNGQRIRRSAETSNRELAEKLAKKVEARMLLGKTPFPSEPQRGLTFAKHTEDWLGRVEGGLRPGSYLTYAQAVREVKPLIGSKLLAEVTRSDALAIVRHLIDGEDGRRSRKTVANLVGALQSAFEDAVSVQGILSKNPFANKAQLLKAAGLRTDELPVEGSGPQPYTIEERDKLLKAAKKKDRWIYAGALLGLRAGLRRSEVLGLKPEDVDLVDRYIHVRRRIIDGKVDNPKTEKSRRTLPLSAELASVLQDQIVFNAKRDRGEWLFPSVRRTASVQDDRRFGDRFKRIVKGAGIDGHRKPFHDLRHTFATDLLLAGVPIFKVSRWLGHSSIQITCDTYGHLLPDPEEHGVVDALDSLTMVTIGHNLVTVDGNDVLDADDDSSEVTDLEGNFWHAGRDSNPRPSGSKPDALSS